MPCTSQQLSEDYLDDDDDLSSVTPVTSLTCFNCWHKKETRCGLDVTKVDFPLIGSRCMYFLEKSVQQAE